MGHLVSILQRRSPVVHLLAPDQSVAQAVALMAEHRVGEEPDLLEAVPDAAPQRRQRKLRRIAATDRHASSARLHQAVHHLERRGLAAARSADQDQELALSDL